ncbi:MAG: TlpA disulfide reductase family protein [Acidimicrobiia bacterium]
MERRRKLIVAAAGVVVLVVGLAAFWPTGDDAGASSQSASQLDVPFQFVDGSDANLADFAGKPLVVNFWASWCPACVAEMPDFEQVHAALGDQVVFLGMNMQETDAQAADALVDQTGVSYQLGLDPDGRIFNTFGGIAMPTTVFIDADGNVVKTHAGAIFAEDLEEMIRTELLAS